MGPPAPDTAEGEGTEPGWGQRLWKHLSDNAWPYGIGAGALGLGALGMGMFGNQDDEEDPEEIRKKKKRRQLAALLEAEATGKTAAVSGLFGPTHEKQAGRFDKIWKGVQRLGKTIPSQFDPGNMPNFFGKRPGFSQKQWTTPGRLADLTGKSLVGGGLAYGGIKGYEAMQDTSAPPAPQGEKYRQPHVGLTQTPGTGPETKAGPNLWDQAMGYAKPAWEHVQKYPWQYGLGAAGLGLGGVALASQSGEDPSVGRRRRMAELAAEEEKEAMVKRGISPFPAVVAAGLGSTAIGAGLGALGAPKGHRWEGAGRGGMTARTAAAMGLGGGLLGGFGGDALSKSLPEEMQPWAAPVGVGLGALAGGFSGHKLRDWSLGPPSWEKHEHKEHKEKKHEKEGHYPGCKSSRRHQAKQHKSKQRRVRRKHASVELVGSLLGIIKQAFEKCGCGCSTCAKCGTGEKQKVRVINGPDVRTNKGHFAWRGRNAKSVSEDPTYSHFGTKAGSLGAHAATLALSLPAPE